MILHIKLISGQEIVGQYVSEDEDYILLKFPLAVEYIQMNGLTSFNLTKYLPFSSSQSVSFQLNHCLSITETTELFEKFYVNSVLYQEYFVLPQSQEGIEAAANQMEFLVSPENLDFLEKLRQFKSVIPTFPTTLQ